ncbi:MAG: TolC family protein [candidate division KSB1 bacterium]|nr:TolC family protein [candidate division KSB1 bacterium]MDZ7367058.1 TolC family protein [candidate division KSB1 bacterium]
MKKLLPIAAVLFFLTLVASACAQTLSLDDCLRLALKKNARLVAAEYDIRAVEQRLKEVGTLRKPSVNLNAGASFAPVTGFDPALTEGGEYAGLIEIKQTLYDGTIRFNRQQTEVNRQQATNAKIRTAADIRLEVRQAYLDLLNAQRQYRLMQQSIADLQSYLETVRALANGGAVPKTDIMKVEIQLQSEQIALNDLSTAMTAAMTRLLEPLGLPLDTTIAIQDSVTLPSLPQPFLNNPDLKEFGFVVEAATLDVKLAQKERLPIISAFGNAGAWTSRNQLLESSSPQVLGYHAGIALELPLWNWGATSARIEQKTAELNARRADYETLRRRLAAEYQTNSIQQRTAAEKLNLLQASRQQAQEQYDLLVAQYAGGGTSALEVLEAHRMLLGFVLQEEQTRAGLDLIHAQLLRLTGEPE